MTLLTRLELVLFVTLAVTFQGMAAAPEIQPIADTTIDEQTLLAFTVVATDPDVPAQQLTFSLGSGIESGATLNGLTGEFRWTPTEAQGPGTNLFSVIVTDDGVPSLSATQRFTVVVFDINRPPVIEPIADQAVNEGALLVVSALATDLDLPFQSISFALGSNSPAGASISPGGLITWLTDESHGPGTNSFQVIATDSGSPSLSATQTFFVVVNEVNIGPTMANIPDRSVNEGELLTFTITATDPDRPAQPLTFSLGAGSPEGASVNPTTGVFTWIPGENYGPGTYYFNAYATDSGSPPQLDAREFHVTVAEVNRAPEIAPIGDKVVDEGQFLGFSVFATDPDAPAQTITLSLSTNAPAGASLSPGGFFSWSPTTAQGPATYTFAVSASDNGIPSLSVTQSITIVVQELNFAPSLAAIDDQSINEGELFSFTASASDPNGASQTLTFRLGDGAPEGATIDPVTGAFAWTPTEAQGPAQGPGSFQIGIIVTDNGTPPLAAALSFLVNVAEVNRAPVLAPIADQTINVGGLLVFTLPVEDPDIPHQTLSYALGANAPAGAAISEGGLFTWTPTAAQLFTTNRLVVTASDGSLSSTQRFTVIVVEANLAPALAAIDDQSISEGNLFSIAASASDPNGPSQTLTFRLGDGAPEGATIDPLTGVLAWTPTEFQGPGSFQIGVIVTDNGTPPLSAARSFLVNVAEVNRPPVLSPIADQTINVGGFLVFTLPVEDPDIPHQALSYSLGANAPAGAAISEGGLFTWTPTTAQLFTTNRLVVTVTDGSLSSTQRFTVIVVEANLAPALAAIDDQSISEGNLFSIAASASDPNGPSQTLTFRLGDGAPEGATIDPLTGVLAWTPTEFQGPGSFQIGVIVTDNGTPPLSAARSFLVNVAEVNRAPVLAPIADQTINVGGLLVFTLPVEDPDIPHQALSYSLGTNAPAGAAISETGLFTWTPTAAQASSTNVFDVVVADNGFPSRSGTNQIRIIVTIGTLTRPTLRSQTLADGTFTVIIDGVSGRTYFLERTLSLAQPDWVAVDEVVGSGGPLVLTDLNPTGSQSFYRARTQ